MRTECARCGVTPGDLPYEELGLSLDDAAHMLFDCVDGATLCQGCAQIWKPRGTPYPQREVRHLTTREPT